jgi:hypothetical protein
MNKQLPIVFFLVLALMISIRVSAHHGDAAYETAKTISVKGTVTAYSFINPHVQIFIEAKTDKGEVEKWQPAGAPRLEPDDDENGRRGYPRGICREKRREIAAVAEGSWPRRQSAGRKPQRRRELTSARIGRDGKSHSHFDPGYVEPGIWL